jgi:pyridine nucleotide-disulfide oxidoreductase family protein
MVNSSRLVLIGGGHSQAIALKLWGLNPLPGVSLTLISDVEYTPYSGMLPGYVAGFYSYRETHINLISLARFAGANLIIDRAIGLDLERNRVICRQHPPVEFDYLSLDIGSTPQTITVPGAREYAIPAKPVPVFLAAWEKLLTQVASNPNRGVEIAIVGGGAGGVELALNMQTRLENAMGNWGKRETKNNSSQKIKIHLIDRGDRLLSNHHAWVSKRLTNILLRRGIQLHLRENVGQVFLNKLTCESGLQISCDCLFWVTQASPAHWIAESRLAKDKNGFILVTDTLQSVSHPHIFAAGDIATMKNYQRPKAGVFAVRQGKPLFENWQNILTGKPLQPYQPQSKYLALIGTGDKSAIASWGNLGWQSFWLWYLKDYIDRQFMQRFENLT